MKLILFVIALPLVLLSWLAIGILFCARFVRDLKWDGIILTAKWRRWVLRFWHYSTTIGTAVVYHPAAFVHGNTEARRVIAHEKVHTRQMADEMFKSFLVGIAVLFVTGDALLAFCLWTSGILWILVHYLAALLRYGPKRMYRGAEHERAAYAQSDCLHGESKSWLELETLDQDR